MIDIKELRIDNWVSTPLGYGKVLKIDSLKKKRAVVSGSSYSGYFLMEEIEPIKITEGILRDNLKFLENRRNEFLICYVAGMHAFNIWYNTELAKMVYLNVYNSEIQNWTICNHELYQNVHSLQNLYFCWYQKELGISFEDKIIQ